MRKNSFLRLCLCLAVALFELPLMAQGVIVYKKDGTRVKFPYETIDSIVTYNVEDDPVAPPANAMAVDLGLSVKWASCNVGAEFPEENGYYFAWGETMTRSSNTKNNSVTYGLSISELESCGIIGADGNLTAAYDAATVNWGDSWRMPTKAEQDELRTECDWEWTTMNGVNGYKVIGPNGNSIFLPAAGCRNATLLRNVGSSGYYWSATPSSGSDDVYYLYFYSGYYDWSGLYSYYGQVVRPVSE